MLMYLFRIILKNKAAPFLRERLVYTLYNYSTPQALLLMTIMLIMAADMLLFVFILI